MRAKVTILLCGCGKSGVEPECFQLFIAHALFFWSNNTKYPVCYKLLVCDECNKIIHLSQLIIFLRELKSE